MSTPIRLGISTCPNDTFAFHGLLSDLVDTRGLDFQIKLLDIQQLNDGLFADRFDVGKASFHAALLLADRMCVLPSGSALGFGVGPLLLASQPNTQPDSARPSEITLCPGELTTATLLFKLFYPGTTQIRHTVFSDIMPELQKQDANFGVCIHEGRFTWQEAGLGLVEDLGARWESETSQPLPLGGILAQQKLPSEVLRNVQATIAESLELALADPQSALPTMRKHAQEFNDNVLMQHVDLYVNDWTRDLGEVGRAALAELCNRSRKHGVVPESAAELRIFDPANA